ncbi:uncharacterized protein BDZ99DRAFT_569364 [Mytilinidion resinicola]|uniref:Ferric oxidoreductase domain-containing protein n=1 Tax=Mytilinidion resinicola TaxID=574789 RepID=A0A6A6YW03_9PEZI|nr:uncharacterized protein BDZ99DRAFT_569364 [Mytilinidion resinicola]KAF2812738.1 hypothetical protein BDZ99DRAFT_569364 [Mytilinidion resinicola]
MAPGLFFLVAICLNSLLATAVVSNSRRGHRLISYGITMYKPTCAFACRDTISGSPLNCSTEEMEMGSMDMGGASTGPECYATDESFLQTLAWCISTHCQGVTVWKLERFWRMNVAGNGAVQPDPKETYQRALAKVTNPPTEILVTGDPLNKTSLVTEDDWIANYNVDSISEIQEDTHERYCLVVFLSGVVIPIGFSLVRFVPWPAHLVTKSNAHIIYPPAFGSHHNQKLHHQSHWCPKWVAWICTIEAVIHSCIYLQIYAASGEHSSESKMPYWIWGAIATLGMSILLPTSILPLRQKLYEGFLLWHIAISGLVATGCYLHIDYRFGHQWGYEVWIYVAMAVWAFERMMRLAKLVRNGLRTATVTVIDDDYLRVDVEGVSGNGHAYLYFPTLTWRVWENHPFSVASTVLPAATHQTSTTSRHEALASDIEKHPVQTSTSQTSRDIIELHHKKRIEILRSGLPFSYVPEVT